MWILTYVVLKKSVCNGVNYMVKGLHHFWVLIHKISIAQPSVYQTYKSYMVNKKNLDKQNQLNNPVGNELIAWLVLI